MDIFYEESATSSKAKSESKKYRTLEIMAYILFIIGFLLTVVGCSVFNIKDFFIWVITFCVWFFLSGFLLWRFKNRYNASYDYAFVSGELRIARVINTTKRKPIARLQPDDMLQLGDVENTAFEGLRADPNVKLVLCTPNAEPAEGKFFMYILAAHNGKKLFVLECKEELLVNIMKFVKRTTLESDYVPQDKKNKA